ncbi:MAG: PIN domain-containing protein [Vicinamibacterales bacterium]
MSLTMVQIRNVPSDFHRRLKARAAIEGMSMSDFILREVGKALDRPTRQEVLLQRAWALRGSLTSYDAMYVAVAEALDATLVTCDARLSRAAGSKARIEVVK